MAAKKGREKEDKKAKREAAKSGSNPMIVLYVLGGFVAIIAVFAAYMTATGTGAPSAEAVAHSDTGNKLLQEGRAQAAAQEFEKAIEIFDYGKFRFQAGVAYHNSNQDKKAIEHYKRCVELPSSGYRHMCYNNMGVLHQRNGNMLESAEAYENAIKTGKKGWAQPQFNLGKTYWVMDEIINATKWYGQAHASDPYDELWLHISTLLPKIYTTYDDLKFWHKRYVDEVDKMWRRKDLKFRDPLRLFETVFPYYLSYHGQNDVETYSKIGDICRRADPSLLYVAPHVKIALSQPQLPAATRGPNEKIRVGFSSLYFKTHASAKMIRGIIETIDHKKFHVVVFALREVNDPPNPFPPNDPVAKAIKKAAHKYIDLPKTSLNDMRKVIERERLDVMIWAEIGMDPANYLSSFGKLAPVSIATHGHASTTGVPTIDYYVTYRPFEIESAQKHYSEKLITLPGFSYYHWPEKYADIDRWTKRDLGLLEGYPNVYSCTQTLWKITPDFDEVFRQILLKDPKGQLVVKVYGGRGANFLGDKVRKRFQATLSDVLDRVTVIDALSDSQYMALQKQVDVVLDSYPFGGYTTSLECFSLGTPVVTLPHPLFAGRCTYGFYKLMGFTDLVARTRGEFVDLAVKYGTDKALNKEVRKKILANNKVLFESRSAMPAWDQILEEVAVGKKPSYLHAEADPSEFKGEINGDWPAA
eukprot:comp10318_c0_seq1/m.5119 comp10318_c0_seq1/g.5119  ORF comp10318_c0_seq1/g.5119 comp10318_c0_seq1/m.5119 type:complete len:699 (-) comp10318_c0_seq1:691-2787(-)